MYYIDKTLSIYYLMTYITYIFLSLSPCLTVITRILNRHSWLNQDESHLRGFSKKNPTTKLYSKVMVINSCGWMLLKNFNNFEELDILW